MTTQPISGETDQNQHSAPLSALMAALDIGDEYFWYPRRLVPFEHWVGHIPFAFWIVKILKPRSFVELGVHRGNSYCAMCQAVETLRLDSVGYAVDTWQGDLHMAFEDGLLAELRSEHDPRYGAFSTLMPMTFDAARGMFSENSIDLLHIDGTHTYDAVRHDFENWLPALSSRGVVLFHDTNVRKDDFGVWRLWEELSARFPAFHFPHSNGLGVLGVGSDLPEPLRALLAFASNPQASARIRAHFASRGDALVERLLLSQAETRLNSVTAALRAEAAAESSAAKLKAEQREAALRAEGAAKVGAARAEAEQREAALRIELNAARANARADLAARTQMGADQAAATAVAQREISLRAQATAQLQAAVARLEQNTQEHEALRQAAEAAAAQLRAIEQSTMWRTLHPVRAILRRIPAGPRRLGRRAFKLVWWTATFQLPKRLKEPRTPGLSGSPPA